MRRILLTGGDGQIGWELRRTLAPLGQVLAPERDRLDLANPDSLRAAIRAARPQAIVNAAAFSSMDKAEAAPDAAMQVNGIAPGILAEEAKRLNALLVHYSSAYVFDGTGTRPYVEDDTPAPINAYGRSKLAGERAIAAVGAAHVILRLSWVHSLRGANFLTAILKLAREKDDLPVVDDQVGSPTWARSIADASARILAQWRAPDGPTGVFHLTAAGAVSRYGFARETLELLRRLGTPARAAVRPVTTGEYPLPATRPRMCLLDNGGVARAFGVVLDDWRCGLEQCLGALAGDSQKPT
jgi:dTDP-4-dehydrorhamnose reductase